MRFVPFTPNSTAIWYLLFRWARKRADVNTLGTAAAEATAEAIVRAVETAKGLGGVPSCRELGTGTREQGNREQEIGIRKADDCPAGTGAICAATDRAAP